MLSKFTQPLEKIISLFFILTVNFYRILLSPLFGPNCRFYPSCSEYALLALKEYSIGKALWLISKRLLKCHPFGCSGYDPLPQISFPPDESHQKPDINEINKDDE